MTRRRTLRTLVEAKAGLLVPGAYDGVSAKLVQQAGFPAVYMTGYGTSASRLYRFKGINPGDSGEAVVAPAGLNDLWAAPDGTLWAGTSWHGLVRFRPGQSAPESVPTFGGGSGVIALWLDPDGTLSLSQTQLVHFVRPSADLLFESVAASYRERALAVVLTGTGIDGTMGVQAIKKMGGTVIAQDEPSSDFFGMPGAAIQTGSVDFILPLTAIAPTLVGLVVKPAPVP